MSLGSVRADLKKLENPSKAKLFARFFKTGKGEYAEGDRFLGISVPQIRKIAKKYASSHSLKQTIKLLKSLNHEERLCALLILAEQFRKGDEKAKSAIYALYLANTKTINNWDLVDSSAYHIVGAHLANKPKQILWKLARSKNLWERRIAVVSTFHFIRSGKHQETFRVAGLLMKDPHDLIHKAAGWMLRECGKRCGAIVLEKFLKPRYKKMPRTMLRYAIERFPKPKRMRYLKGNV